MLNYFDVSCRLRTFIRKTIKHFPLKYRRPFKQWVVELGMWKELSLSSARVQKLKLNIGCKHHGKRESRFFYWNVYVFNETHPYILTRNGDEISNILTNKSHKCFVALFINTKVEVTTVSVISFKDGHHIKEWQKSSVSLFA